MLTTHSPSGIQGVVRGHVGSERRNKVLEILRNVGAVERHLPVQGIDHWLAVDGQLGARIAVEGAAEHVDVQLGVRAGKIGDKPNPAEFALLVSEGELVGVLDQFLHRSWRTFRIESGGCEQVLVPEQSVDVAAPGQAEGCAVRPLALRQGSRVDVIRVDAGGLDPAIEGFHQALLIVGFDQIRAAQDHQVWRLGTGQSLQQIVASHPGCDLDGDTAGLAVVVQERLQLGRVVAPRRPHIDDTL